MPNMGVDVYKRQGYEENTGMAGAQHARYNGNDLCASKCEA